MNSWLGRFSYLGVCISPGGRISGVAFVHTGSSIGVHQFQISLAPVQRVIIDQRSSLHCYDTFGSVVRFGKKSLLTEDKRSLSVFELRVSSSIARIW